MKVKRFFAKIGAAIMAPGHLLNCMAASERRIPLLVMTIAWAAAVIFIEVFSGFAVTWPVLAVIIFLIVFAIGFSLFALFCEVMRDFIDLVSYLPSVLFMHCMDYLRATSDEARKRKGKSLSYFIRKDRRNRKRIHHSMLVYRTYLVMPKSGT